MNIDEYHIIYPVFLEFTDQMENRSKDGYGKSAGCIPLKGRISQNLPLYTFALLFSLVWK